MNMLAGILPHAQVMPRLAMRANIPAGLLELLRRHGLISFIASARTVLIIFRTFDRS